jgi:IS605 OrfB family transposase
LTGDSDPREVIRKAACFSWRSFTGVDLGVENIAVDSDGGMHSSSDIEAKRRKYAARRKAIGRKTGGASRKTRRQCHKAMARAERKEARYRKNENHRIAKELVEKAKDTDRGIALEDLKGIRDRVRFRKPQRARMGGWAFFQLRSFVEYKAQLAGVPVVAVDPRNTSRTCSRCGHCEKANRKSQAEFVCQQCGYSEHADLNAALNLRDRARVAVNLPLSAGKPPGPSGRSVQAESLPASRLL